MLTFYDQHSPQHAGVSLQCCKSITGRIGASKNSTLNFGVIPYPHVSQKGIGCCQPFRCRARLSLVNDAMPVLATLRRWKNAKGWSEKYDTPFPIFRRNRAGSPTFSIQDQVELGNLSITTMNWPALHHAKSARSSNCLLKPLSVGIQSSCSLHIDLCLGAQVSSVSPIRNVKSPALLVKTFHMVIFKSWADIQMKVRCRGPGNKYCPPLLIYEW